MSEMITAVVTHDQQLFTVAFNMIMRAATELSGPKVWVDANIVGDSLERKWFTADGAAHSVYYDFTKGEEQPENPHDAEYGVIYETFRPVVFSDEDLAAGESPEADSPIQTVSRLETRAGFVEFVAEHLMGDVEQAEDLVALAEQEQDLAMSQRIVFSATRAGCKRTETINLILGEHKMRLAFVSDRTVVPQEFIDYESDDVLSDTERDVMDDAALAKAVSDFEDSLWLERMSEQARRLFDRQDVKELRRLLGSRCLRLIRT